MAKTPATHPLHKPYGFYRPHRRVQFDGNVITRHGEVEIPASSSMTKQAFVEECDINNILSQYTLTGQIKHISAKAESGAYQDLPDEIDFQQSLNTVIRAEQAFASLPSQVRNRFHNNPGEFLEFVTKPENQDEAIKLGLALDNRPAPVAPLDVRVVAEPAPEPAPKP